MRPWTIAAIATTEQATRIKVSPSRAWPSRPMLQPMIKAPAVSSPACTHSMALAR